VSIRGENECAISRKVGAFDGALRDQLTGRNGETAKLKDGETGTSPIHPLTDSPIRVSSPY